MKKKILILVSICLVILIGGIIYDNIASKTYFNEIKYKDVIKKLDNKDTFILLISQTTCTHCLEYKPKLETVANDEKVSVYYIEYDLLNKEEAENFNKRISFSGTPTTVFFKNGEEKTAATRINGSASIEKIKAKLKSNGFIK